MVASASELIAEIENDFARLQREYMLFLNDQSKIEPADLRDRLEAKVKRLRNWPKMRTEEQFRTNNLVTRIQSHIQLWQRRLEQKYSGRGQRKPPPRKTPTAAPKPKPKRDNVVISDVSSQREQVVKLYDEYTRLNLLTGGNKMVNFSKFQNFINNQTRKIQQAKGVNKVSYEIAVQNEKVVIKSKSVREK